jgi:hypothetical protein
VSPPEILSVPVTERPVRRQATDEDRSAARLAAQRAWIALLRGDGDTVAAGPAALTEPHWPLLAQEARRHQLGALTYRLLTEHPRAHGAPAGVLEGLRPAYLDVALRNAVFFRHTSRITKELAAEGIPVMLLKGIHLARYVYAEPAMRSMADVDIMVPRARLADAERIFLENGYGPTPRPDIEEFCSWSNHLAKLIKPNAPVMEVHWGIERPASPFAIDSDGLWARSRTESLEGAPVQLLAHEDLLLHLVLHASYHHRFDRSAFKGLYDIHAVVVRHGHEIDWNRLAERAVQWKAAGFTYSTLRLTTELLGTPIPAPVLHSLPREREDEEIIEIARRYILMPGQQLPKVYLKLARSQSISERAALLVRHVFLPRRRMERVYGVRRGSHLIWAYYAYRLGELLVKRGALPLRALFRTRDMRAPIDREEQRVRIEGWVKDLPGAGRH